MLSGMRAILPVIAGAALIALAGCGTVHAPAGGSTGTQTGQPTPTSTTSTTPRGQTAKQRAQADAAALLASFVPPPGASRLPKAPNLPGGYLKNPITFLGDGYQVDGTTFWQAPGAPTAVLNWEIAHISHRFSIGDADFSVNGSPADRSFELPAIPGVLTSRDLVVEVVSMGAGETGIRVDAEVGWQPPRPASDQVPAAARLVMIAEETTMQTGQGLPSPVTITDPAVVAKLAALVNSMPISPINGIAVSCPAGFGSALTLTFRAGPGAAVLASVQTDQSCGVSIFSANPNQYLAFIQPANLDQRILGIAGLPWKLG
jgi:hypothetical protein